jgi:xanthine/uracil permease
MAKVAELLYGLDDLPSWPKNLIYGIQWALIFLPTLTILSTISATYLGFQGSDTVLFFQRMLVVTGTVMILQTLWGHRYPLLDGPSSALLLSFVIMAPQGMPAIQGGMIVGGIFLLLLGFLGLMRYLERLFTDKVIGVILILIAVTLLPYLGPMVIQDRPGHVGDATVLGISLSVMAAIAVFSYWLWNFPKTISFLLGILFGTVLMMIAGRTSFGEAWQSPWFALPQSLFPAPPHFSLAAAVTFLVAYLAVIVNAMGSIYSVGEIVGKKEIGSRLARGIACTGFGGLAAGACGVIGTVSYGFSPGVILVTQVGTRYAVTVCGFLLLVLACFPKILALLSAIPVCVVGAAMLTGMAAQVGAGISVVTRSGRPLDGRDYLITGLPLLLGGSVSFFPDLFFQSFPSQLQGLMKNGMVLGILAVLFLEHVFLRPKPKSSV